MIKDTACENCPFKAQGFKECPNYIETTWFEKDNPTQPKLVRDCAPRRTLLMLQDLYTRCYGMQVQISQTEGAMSALNAVFKQMMDIAKGSSQMIEAKEDAKVSHLSQMSLRKEIE